MAEYVPLTLNRFKQLINAGGTTPARNNLFAISIDIPTVMAPQIDAEVVDMLRHYSVHVHAPSKNIMSNPIRREHAHFETPYGISYEPISVTFYMDTDFRMRQFFRYWYDTVYDSGTNGIAFRDTFTSRAITIHAVDKLNNATYSFEMKNAFPKSISGLDFEAQADGQAATFTVEFQYEKLVESRLVVEPRRTLFGNIQRFSDRINSFEINPPDSVERSILPKSSSIEGVGRPVLREPGFVEDVVRPILYAPANLVAGVTDVAENIFSKFTPKTIFGKEE